MSRRGLHAGDDAVEALAVEVDDPDHVAEALERRVGDGLPHVALVELGVADEGDEAGVGPVAPKWASMYRRVAAANSGATAPSPTEPVEKSNTSGSFVRARVGLQAAELAQAREVAAVELAGEVLDGVEDGRGVRLDGDLVVAVEVTEPQRRHDARPSTPSWPGGRRP